MEQLQEYLGKKKAQKIDYATLIDVLTYLKQCDRMTEDETEGDEYIDAFVFLGGQPNKDGYIQKSMLIAIITEEFGLTIDMQVSFYFETAIFLLHPRNGFTVKI